MAAQSGSAAPGAAPAKRGDWKHYTKLGAIGVVVVLALIFIFQNTQKVAVSFLWAEGELQMWIVMLILFVVGMLAGFLIAWRRARRRRREYRR